MGKYVLTDEQKEAVIGRCNGIITRATVHGGLDPQPLIDVLQLSYEGKAADLLAALAVGIAASFSFKRVAEDFIEVTAMIDWDETIEQMAASDKLTYSNPDLITANFGKCKAGKSGRETVTFYLYRAASSGEVLSTRQVGNRIRKAGYVSEELPFVAVLKDHCTELRSEGVSFVTALGKSSRWRDPYGGVYVPYLSLESRRFDLYYLDDPWYDYDWFVVRRK